MRQSAYIVTITDLSLGLQTPRLKRLAEIVSAQAMAQQERLEYDSPGQVTEDGQGLAISDVEGV